MEYFLLALEPGNLLALLAGVVVGLVVGLLPGLTANLGVALLLPMTYRLDPVAALLLLMSLYTAAIYGGSLSAILLKTPGTSASAPTAIEGFALTERGESAAALRIATVASVVGGAASGVALLVVAPPLARLALEFGPAESFMLALCGLTVLATLASDDRPKGLLAGAAGLLLSTVGLDLESGAPRFTFGSEPLQGGIGFVPAVIGLFSISQALVLCEEPNRSVQTAPPTAGDWRWVPSRQELRLVAPSLVRSSVIGLLVGVVPGAGADIGAWVSYHEARRTARDPDEFGRGSLVGIAAAEAGNNAVTGGSLIPLLTLGIPGSATAAVLLGALILHGLAPGPALFSEHPAVSYPVLWGFLLANVTMGLVGLLLGRALVPLARLPRGALVPVVFVLGLVGSYALNASLWDVWVMLAFGLLGYGMQKSGFHPAPLAVGLILGPLAETGLRQLVTLADGSVAAYILRRPIALLLAGVAIFSLVSGARLNPRSARPRADGS